MNRVPLRGWMTAAFLAAGAVSAAGTEGERPPAPPVVVMAGVSAERLGTERFEIVALRDPEIVVRRLPIPSDASGSVVGDAGGDAPVQAASTLLALIALMGWITVRRSR